MTHSSLELGELPKLITDDGGPNPNEPLDDEAIEPLGEPDPEESAEFNKGDEAVEPERVETVEPED